MTKILFLVLQMTLLSSCVQVDAEAVFASKPFALVTTEDGSLTTLSATVDDEARTISFLLAEHSDLSSVDVLVQLNPGFEMVDPSAASFVCDLTSPKEITVDGKYSETVTYLLSASKETPVESAVFRFRGESIPAEIDNGAKTITFPVSSIYASEYPSELLSDVKVDIVLKDGYKMVTAPESWDLASGSVLRVKKGNILYSYTVIADIKPIAVADHLSDFDIHRGVNLSYWMVVDGSDREWLGYIDPKAFPMWKELGFDHFRMPVKESVLFNEDGSFHKLAVDKLHELFSWCEENEFYVILDMHELSPRPGTSSYREEDLYDPAYPEFRKHFVEMWGKIAEEFCGYSCGYVAYELLNEPHDSQDDASGWNKLQNEVLTAIREHDPERVVFVPSMGWQDYNYIKHSKISDGDPNVLISFHYYLPMLLTHYKMLAWKEYQGSIQYPGTVIPSKADADAYPKYSFFYHTVYNAVRISGEMSVASADGANIGRKVHCGEFGCSKNVPSEMRYQWFADMLKALEENNIPWTLWESLGGGFGFVDENGMGQSRIDRTLLKILTGKELTEEQAKAILEKYGIKTY